MPRSRRIVVAGPCPVSTRVESASGRTTSRSEAAHRGVVPARAGRCGRSSRRTARRRTRPSGPAPRRRAVRRGRRRGRTAPTPRCVPARAGPRARARPGRAAAGRRPRRPARARATRGLLPELLLEHRDEAEVEGTQRVGQPVAVVVVDVCREGPAADGGHRVHVVGVPVGEQHRGRPEAVLGEHGPQRVLDPDPGVDDQALLPRPGGEDVAVRREGGGGEGHGEHSGSLAEDGA